MESEREEIRWLTVDGPLGLGSQDTESARRQARNFFYAGFAFLPWLWFVNCFYFWPILRRSYHPDPFLRSCKCSSRFSISLSLSYHFASVFYMYHKILRLFGIFLYNVSVSFNFNALLFIFCV